MKNLSDPVTDHASHVTYDALHALLRADMETVGAAVKHLAEEHHADGVADLSCLILLNVCAETVNTKGATYSRPNDLDIPAPYVNAVAAAVDHRWNEAGEHLGLLARPEPTTVAQALSHLLSLTRRCMQDQGVRMAH